MGGAAKGIPLKIWISCFKVPETRPASVFTTLRSSEVLKEVNQTARITVKRNRFDVCIFLDDNSTHRHIDT